MRSVRLAVFLKCKIHPDTGRQIRQAAALLEQVSPERVRDELFRMLDSPEPATAVRLLDMLGILPYVLPELTPLKGVPQPAELYNQPLSKADVWTHTLESVKRLGQVLQVLSISFEQEKAANWALGLISVQLGRYRQQLAEHLAIRINPERSLRSLLFLAGLYHDVGKPNTQQVDSSGRMRFYGHEQVGARLVAKRARHLRLSNDEIERLAILVENHMRPLLLAQSGEAPSRRAIYRYFRTTGSAGIDLGLFSLADSLATFGPALPRENWAQHLAVVRALCEAWWEQPDQIVTPPVLVDGHDLLELFNLQPGPLVGDLLEAVRESQAAGQVNTRQQALDLVDNRLKGIG
jgi:putative nucleotidyltransferase with HDIG domain